MIGDAFLHVVLVAESRHYTSHAYMACTNKFHYDNDSYKQCVNSSHTQAGKFLASAKGLGQLVFTLPWGSYCDSELESRKRRKNDYHLLRKPVLLGDNLHMYFYALQARTIE